MTNVMSEHPWTRFYEKDVPAALTYPDSTLGAVLSQTAQKFPDHTALLFYGARISYAGLDRLVNQFAHALLRLGVQSGDRVAIMLPNVPQMVIAYYGTLRTGAIAVPTNPLYHEHELEVQLKDSGAETLVALDLFYPTISQVLPRTRVKHLILAGVKDFLPFPKNLLYPIKAWIEKQWVSVKYVPPVFDFLQLIRNEPAGPVDRTVTERPGRAPAVHRRHDRRAQGRSAYAPEPGGERGPEQDLADAA